MIRSTGDTIKKIMMNGEVNTSMLKSVFIQKISATIVDFNI